MDFPHGETVTRLRATNVIDPYSGENVEDWSVPTTKDFPRCAVAPGGSTEPLSADRQSVESDYDVMFPSGSDVTARDRLIIRGAVCQVDGEPFDWKSPLTGWAPGLVARATKVVG